MFNFHACCRLCLKQDETVTVSCVEIKELSVAIKNAFGLEVNANDNCSTKICRECVNKVSTFAMYRDTVLANQKCIEQYQSLQSKVLHMDIKGEDSDDDVIFVASDILESNDLDLKWNAENLSAAKNRSLNNIISKDVSEECHNKHTAIKRTARKSTTKLPYEIQKSTEKLPSENRILLKKLRIHCNYITEEAIKNLSLTKKDRKLLKLPRAKSKKLLTIVKENNSDEQNQTTSNLKYPPIRINLHELIKKISRDKESSKENENCCKDKPTNINFIPILKRSSKEAKSSEIVPSKTVSCTTISQKNDDLSRPSIEAKSSEKVIPKTVIPSSLSKPYDGGENMSNPTNPSGLRRSLNLISSTSNNTSKFVLSSPPVSTAVTIPNTVCNQTAVTQKTAVSARSTDLVSNQLVHSLSTSVTNTNFNPLVNVVSTRTTIPSHIAETPNGHCSLNRENITDVDEFIPMEMLYARQSGTINALNITNNNKVKILSVNDINMRVESSSNNKYRRLPIRITLVKIRNKIQIKLTDSSNSELHFRNLSFDEQTAIKNTLTQPVSREQIQSAFQTCKPDQYSIDLLTCIGLSPNSFIW